MGGIGNPGFFGTVGVEGTTVHIFRGDPADSEAARIIDAKGTEVLLRHMPSRVGCQLRVLSIQVVPRIRSVDSSIVGSVIWQVETSTIQPFLTKTSLLLRASGKAIRNIISSVVIATQT